MSDKTTLLTCMDVADRLQISRSFAYTLCREVGSPPSGWAVLFVSGHKIWEGISRRIYLPPTAFRQGRKSFLSGKV